MRLLKMPKRSNTCLLYSAAMVLDCTINRLIEIIGHDGTEKIWDANPPYCYRNFHIQEIIDCSLEIKKKGLYPIQVHPMIASRGQEPIHIYSDEVAMSRFLSIIKYRRGILINTSHACAWDGVKVFDPIGEIKTLDTVPVAEMWLL